MTCQTCDGRHGWWIDPDGKRLTDAGTPVTFTWHECGDCIKAAIAFRSDCGGEIDIESVG